MQAFLKGATKSEPAPGTSQTTKPPPRSVSVPWVEKYRPRTVEDVVEQNEVIQVLKESLASGDLPHLLFYGPPGTGKTSSILAAARQLFGDITKDRVLEMNASDERGIQVVRDKIKKFSQLTASSTRPDGRSYPPFKLVILDEADSMTKDAQSALRRIMEKETRSTRFCLVCNYVSRIIPPITSRCSKFRFKPLSKEKITEKLEDICKKENLHYDPKDLEIVVDSSGGDLRRAITCLQSCARLGGTVNTDSIIEVTGLIPNESIKEFITLSEYPDLESFIERFTLEAYSAAQLLVQANEMIVDTTGIGNKQKALICEKLAECEFRLMEGGSEKIQLMDLGCTIILANKV